MTPSDAAPFEILLLEDDPADARLIGIALEETGLPCHLSHVADGLAGLAFLRREGNQADAPRPDLILLDLNMPHMNGREFLRHLKADAALCGLPVVVLTTSVAERDVRDCYLSGASGFISKPLDMDDFIHTLRQVSDYWFTAVRLPGKR